MEFKCCKCGGELTEDILAALSHFNQGKVSDMLNFFKKAILIDDMQLSPKDPVIAVSGTCKFCGHLNTFSVQPGDLESAKQLGILGMLKSRFMIESNDEFNGEKAYRVRLHFNKTFTGMDYYMTAHQIKEAIKIIQDLERKGYKPVEEL